MLAWGMALRLIRRHLKDCSHTSTKYRRCKRPIHVYGTLGGEKIRKALDQTSWAPPLTRSTAGRRLARSESSRQRLRRPGTRSKSFSQTAKHVSSVGRRCGSTGISSRIDSSRGPSSEASTISARSTSTPCGNFARLGKTGRSTPAKISNACDPFSGSVTRQVGPGTTPRRP